LSRRISQIEPDHKGVPVLLRQYLRLGAQILAFNVDSEFGDVLDGLMIIDLRQLGPDVLARYMGRSAMINFRAYHGLDGSVPDSAAPSSGDSLGARVMIRARAGWLCVLAWLVAPAVGAQTRPTTTDVTGVVYDQSHAVLPAATVTATNTETNQVRSVMTDAIGRFTIPALPPGEYAIKAELRGFSSQTQRGVILRLGTEVAVDFTLTLASTEEQITVFASANDSFQTAIASVVTQEQINTLPINGRNFISFAVITPGVSNDNTPQQGASATSGLTFAGQRARSNNITVDGLDNNDLVVGSVRATFSQEAVREFQVITNSYTAEYGKASGGVVNIVTKSGTNIATGTAFSFFRHDALNAKAYFERFTPAGLASERPKAPYRQKQFGAIFGGPNQEGSDLLLCRVRATRCDDEQFRQHRRHDARDRSRSGRGNGRGHSTAYRVPARNGQRPVCHQVEFVFC
jgi:hypothetical protein